MADAYATVTFARAHLGTDYLTAAVAVTAQFTTLSESATSMVQSAMRNSGYTPPTSTDGTGVEEVVKLATLGVLRELVATRPQFAIPLPPDWENHPAKIAYQQIIDGEMALAAEPDQLGAVGGMQFTESDPDIDDSVPQRTRASEMAGY